MLEAAHHNAGRHPYVLSKPFYNRPTESAVDMLRDADHAAPVRLLPLILTESKARSPDSRVPVLDGP